MHVITLYELCKYPRSMFGNLEVEIKLFKHKSTHNEIVKDLNSCIHITRITC
jgi:hypothetical protein